MSQPDTTGHTRDAAPSADEAADRELLLEASGVTKTYGAVVALRDASLRVGPGEVHALMGANGAGKSTLVKILTGAVRADRGTFVIRGQPFLAHSPADARRKGLVPVYQEPALIPDLDVRSNLRLSTTPVDPFLERVAALGIPRLDLTQIVGELPLATLRVMDLARAMTLQPDVLLLDEMTAALPADLAEKVLAEVGKYRAGGRSVIFISHRLLEILALCDRATVLRDGETVGVLDVGPGAEERVVDLMLGPAKAARPTTAAAPQVSAATADEGQAATAQADRLEVRGLGSEGKLKDVSFSLRTGEVLGVIALEGQGQDDLFAILSGASKPLRGTVLVDGREVRFGHPADAVAAGLVLVPGDRAEGLLMQRSVRENIALPSTAAPRAWGPIAMSAEKQRVEMAIERLDIDTRAQGEVRQLSGGNQQKVTIARWIAQGVETLLCFDPTRGIDVGTKRQIYELLRELAASGAAILLYTSELEEVQLACDRVVVIFGGHVVDEMPAEVADEAALVRAAHGLQKTEAAGGAGTVVEAP